MVEPSAAQQERLGELGEWTARVKMAQAAGVPDGQIQELPASLP